MLGEDQRSILYGISLRPRGDSPLRGALIPEIVTMALPGCQAAAFLLCRFLLTQPYLSTCASWIFLMVIFERCSFCFHKETVLTRTISRVAHVHSHPHFHLQVWEKTLLLPVLMERTGRFGEAKGCWDSMLWGLCPGQWGGRVGSTCIHLACSLLNFLLHHAPEDHL